MDRLSVHVFRGVAFRKSSNHSTLRRFFSLARVHAPLKGGTASSMISMTGAHICSFSRGFHRFAPATLASTGVPLRLRL